MPEKPGASLVDRMSSARDRVTERPPPPASTQMFLQTHTHAASHHHESEIGCAPSIDKATTISKYSSSNPNSYTQFVLDNHFRHRRIAPGKIEKHATTSLRNLRETNDTRGSKSLDPRLRLEINVRSSKQSLQILDVIVTNLRST